MDRSKTSGLVTPISLWIASSLGIAAGLAGGLLSAIVLQQPLVHLLLLGGTFGLFFTVLIGPLARSPGAGLIWGQGAALLLWLLLPARAMPLWFGRAEVTNAMLAATRQQIPELIAFLLCLGMPVGMTLGIYNAMRAGRERTAFRWSRPIVTGALAGLCSGLIFGYWMFTGRFFPMLAGLGDFSSRGTAVLLQFGITLALGAMFGVLFQRDIRSLGSSMGWGLGYTILWWLLGPLTAFPLSRGLPVDWSVANVSDQFGPLVGHILFGLLLGISYAVFDRIWIVLFIQSDPLYRKPEGPALHMLRSLQWGTVAGLLGGLASGPFMFATGVLSHITGTETHLSMATSLLIHLIVSMLIGMSFGILFRNETPGLGLGMIWGSLFGLIWWYGGVLTLLPLILTGSIDWRPSTASMLLPSLIGHLLFGAVAALVFLLLERRFIQRSFFVRPQLQEPLGLQPEATSAPALCLFAIGLGVLLPILLA